MYLYGVAGVLLELCECGLPGEVALDVLELDRHVLGTVVHLVPLNDTVPVNLKKETL